MRARVLVIVSLLAVLALCPFGSAHVGEDSDLAVFITYPAASYDVGSDVIATVTVFKAAQYHDPLEVELLVGETSRAVGLTKEAEGRYKGVVTVQLADLNTGGWMTLSAIATDYGPGGDEAYDWAEVETLVGSSFTVDVDVPDTMDNLPTPGQDVDFIVGIMFRAAPVDPDAGTLKVYFTDPAGTSTDLVTTRVGTGQFQGKLTVPAALKESTRYAMKVEASYTRDSRTYEGEGEYDVFVNFLDVWVHVIAVTPAQARLELHALDQDGVAVAGASVSLDYKYFDDGWDERKGTLTGTTNATGVTAFTLAYTDLGKDSETIVVSGRVRSGTTAQLFEGYLQAREPVPYGPDSTGVGFEATLLTEDPLEAGASVTLENEVRYDDAPMASTVVYIYLYDSHSIYRFGSETTDGQGKFSFPLNVPTLVADEHVRWVSIIYQAETDDGWQYDVDSFQVGDFMGERLLDDLIDPASTMTVDPFSVGETVTVTVDNPAADGIDENAFILWLVGNSTDWANLDNLEWASWSTGVIPQFRLVPCQWRDGKYVATFRCPGFLSTTSKLYMYGFITFTDQGDFFGGAKVAKKENISPLPPNPAPTSTITAPVASQKYGGTLKVRGTAADDERVDKVELRLDGGAWMTVSGTTGWSYDLDTKPLAAGNHTLEVRSHDGQKYSTVASVGFVVDQTVAKKKEDGPGFGAALGALAILAAVAVATAGRSKR